MMPGSKSSSPAHRLQNALEEVRKNLRRNRFRAAEGRPLPKKASLASCKEAVVVLNFLP